MPSIIPDVKPTQFECSSEQNNNERHATKQQSSRHEFLKSFKTRNLQRSIHFQDMNSSSHSRQETCNNPYNSRRAKQISLCVCDQIYHYYIYGARICPPTQSCRMGSIVISGGIIQVQCSFLSLHFGNQFVAEGTCMCQPEQHHHHLHHHHPVFFLGEF